MFAHVCCFDAAISKASSENTARGSLVQQITTIPTPRFILMDLLAGFFISQNSLKNNLQILMKLKYIFCNK